jgi:hypothetical protein
MSGCFGNHPVDRWMESNLNRHLDACDADEEAVEYASERYGGIVTDDGYGFYIFADGKCGSPYLVQDYDEDGPCGASVEGLTDCDIIECKNGTIIAKTYKRVPSKRMSVKKWFGKTKKVVDQVWVIKP